MTTKPFWHNSPSRQTLCNACATPHSAAHLSNCPRAAALGSRRGPPNAVPLRMMAQRQLRAAQRMALLLAAHL